MTNVQSLVDTALMTLIMAFMGLCTGRKSAAWCRPEHKNCWLWVQ